MVKKNNTAIIIAIIVIVVLVAIVVYSYYGKNVRLGPGSVSPQGVVPARPLVNGCFCVCSEGGRVFVIPKTGASCASLNGLLCNGSNDPDILGVFSKCEEGYGMNL